MTSERQFTSEYGQQTNHQKITTSQGCNSVGLQLTWKGNPSAVPAHQSHIHKTTMEELQTKHRKEQRDLQSRVTQKKKQASKKTRKGVNEECDRLEADLKQRQADEIAAFNGEPTSQSDELPIDELDDLTLRQDDDEPKPAEPAAKQPAASALPNSTAAPSQGRKPNSTLR